MLTDLLDRDEVGIPVVVRLEILSGASRRDLARLASTLSALPTLLPRAATWERIERWLEQAASSSDRFAVADLLIAALAAEANARV